MSQEKQVTIVDVSYAVDVTSETKREKVRVTPRVKIESSADTGVIADLRVDGHELLPSARSSVTQGVCERELPSVMIIRERLQKTSDAVAASKTYTMLLRVSSDGKNFHSDVRDIDI